MLGLEMSGRNPKLEEFKEEIRSVLISLPTGLQLNKVGRDYKDFVGKDLPFRELDYPNAFELLCAIPDAVMMERRGRDIVVSAVCNEKTAHVAEMVSKQKKSTSGYPRVPNSARSHKGIVRRFATPPRMQPPHEVGNPMLHHQLPICVPPNLKYAIQQLVREYPEGINIDHLKIIFRHKYGFELNHQAFDYVRVIDFIKSLCSENIVSIQERSNATFVFPPHYLEIQAASNNTPQRPNDSRTKQNIQEEKIQNNETAGNWNNTEINVKVYNNLEQLVERFPKGFPLTQLCDLYNEFTGSTLDYKGLGYNNVHELIDHLDLFRVEVRKSGEWFLIDARLPPEPEVPETRSKGEVKEIPVDIQQNIYDLLHHCTEGILLSQFESVYQMNFNTEIPLQKLNYKDLYSMLDSLDFHTPIRFESCGLNDFKVMLMPKEADVEQVPRNPVGATVELVIPPDAVVLGEVYISPKIPPEDDQYFPVLVSSVDSPGKIWLQLMSQEEIQNVELDELMDALENFYQSPEGSRYKMPERYLKKSMNCAVVYPEDQSWHRASIINKHGPTTYEMFYYDYGTICVVEKDLIRLLKKSFATLPAQAFSARLACVEPIGEYFSAEASQRLFNLVSGNKPLMAQITSKHYMNSVSVILCDTTGDDDVFLNDLLIHENLVLRVQDKVELRTPFSAGSPDGFFLPAFEMQSNTPLSNSVLFSTLHASNQQNPDVSDCVRPLGSIDLRPPPGLSRNSGPESFLSNIPQFTNPYQPPSFNQAEESHTRNPEVIKQLGDSILAKKRSLNVNMRQDINVPRATVEPIQFSLMRDPNKEVIVPLSPLREVGVSANQEPSHAQHQQRQHEMLETQQQELYESSKEDDEQELEGTSNSVTGGTNDPDNFRNQLRFCKGVGFREAKYSAHIINFYGKPCFASVDVSSFIFGVDIIKRILHIQKYPPCHITAVREEHPALFVDLEQSGVLDFTADDEKEDRVVLYELMDVVKILKFLKHDKQTLIEDIEELHNNFDSKDTYWMSRPDSPDNLPNSRQALDAKLCEVKEERKALLRTMLDQDESGVEDVEHLITLDKQVNKIKKKLSKFVAQPASKTAADQAREFLERMKLKKEDRTEVARSTPSPLELIRAAPAMPSGQLSEAMVQTTGSMTTPDEGVFLTNRTALGPQSFTSAAVFPILSNNLYPNVLPVNLAHFPHSSIVYQQFNPSYPATNNVRFPGNFNNSMNWP